MSEADPFAGAEVPARLVFADGRATPARARIVERTAAWRRRSAATQLALWLLAPVAAVVPPHIPWVLLVLGVGGYRAWQRLNEQRTLLSLHGTCPRCGVEQDFGETGRMRHPHVVHCAGCRWELRLEA